jgi:hypothetical protein
MIVTINTKTQVIDVVELSEGEKVYLDSQYPNYTYNYVDIKPINELPIEDEEYMEELRAFADSGLADPVNKKKE